MENLPPQQVRSIGSKPGNAALPAIASAIVIVIVLVVVVTSIAFVSGIRNADEERLFETESHDRLAWNANGASADLAIRDCPDNAANQSALLARFNMLRSCLHAITIPVDRHRDKVEPQVVIPSCT